MTKHPSYRARDQPESGSASQHRKEKTMHKFEKRDAKSRTLVILAVVGLAAAITVGIFTAVRLIRKPAQTKDDPKTDIVYDDSAVEGGWDNQGELGFPTVAIPRLKDALAEYVDTLAPGGGFVYMVMLNGAPTDPEVAERNAVIKDFYEDYVRNYYKNH